jgi:hypothetical protein
MMVVGGVGYWVSKKLAGFLDESVNVEIPSVKNFTTTP